MLTAGTANVTVRALRGVGRSGLVGPGRFVLTRWMVRRPVGQPVASAGDATASGWHLVRRSGDP